MEKKTKSQHCKQTL